MKLQALISSIIGKIVCGEAIICIRPIVFQKRRLPHENCMFYLSRESRASSSHLTVIEKALSAELLFPDNFEPGGVILRQNVHQPYGQFKRSFDCIKTENSQGVLHSHLLKDVEKMRDIYTSRTEVNSSRTVKKGAMKLQACR